MRQLIVVLSLALVALAPGCGGGAAHPASGDPDWPAHPPTRTASCGAPLGACPGMSSIRVRWPDGAHVPEGAVVTLDGDALDLAEVELGVCAAPGMHVLRVDSPTVEADGNAGRRGAGVSVEILAGAETRVVLATGAVPGAYDATAELVSLDVGAMVAALGDAELPAIAYDATPEERRVYAPTLAAAFDAWRARLERVHTFAQTQRDAVLESAATDHEARAQSIALTIAEDRPSADRLSSIRRAMQNEIEAASRMIALERECPVYSDDEDAVTLAQVSVDARPYTGPSNVVVRVRVAIDEVEVLDVGSPRGSELFEHAVGEGLVPPGLHYVRTEATFATRDGVPGRRVLEAEQVLVPPSGTRISVRVREGTTHVHAQPVPAE